MKDKVWVLVECVQSFRTRYMVEAPADHPEYALDTVTMEEAKQFSSLDIGESIVSHRVIEEKEALVLCREDNDYCDTWINDQLKKCFFTAEGDKLDD